MKAFDTIRLRGCIAFLLMAMIGSASDIITVAAQPGPQITGFHWRNRWVTTCDACTKDDTAMYDGLITISNMGTEDFQVDQIVIDQASGGVFQIGATNLMPGTIMRPGMSETLVVYFMPCQQRAYAGAVQLHYTDPATNQSMLAVSELRGAGIESCIQVSDLLIEGEFDAVTPRSSRERLYVRSTGTRPVTIYAVTLQGDDSDVEEFTLEELGPLPVTILPGDTLSFDVSFTPTRMESHIREVVVTMTGDFADVDCPGSCSDSVAAIQGVIATAGVERREVGLGGLSVSPNPAGGALHATVTLDRAHDVRLLVYDASGRAVATHDAGRLGVGTHRIPLDLSALPSGIYLLRVGDLTERIVVVR